MDLQAFQQCSRGRAKLAVSCLRSDDVTDMASVTGSGLVSWSHEPDHVEGTSGPCCGEKGVVSRGQYGTTSSLGSNGQNLFQILVHCSNICNVGFLSL